MRVDRKKYGLGDGRSAPLPGRGSSRWRSVAMDLSLGVGATAEAEGRAEGTPRYSVAREVICTSRAGGATAEVEGSADGAPRSSVKRHIVY